MPPLNKRNVYIFCVNWVLCGFFNTIECFLLNCCLFAHPNSLIDFLIKWAWGGELILFFPSISTTTTHILLCVVFLLRWKPFLFSIQLKTRLYILHSIRCVHYLTFVSHCFVTLTTFCCLAIELWLLNELNRHRVRNLLER